MAAVNKSGFNHPSVPNRSPKQAASKSGTPLRGRPALDTGPKQRVVGPPNGSASPHMKKVHVPGGSTDLPRVGSA